MDQFLLDPEANSQDQVLIARSLAGDRAALEALVSRHRDYIYNIALRLFLDKAEAEDAAQEVLIKMVTQLQRFQGRSAFRTWLYRIAVNHFLRMRKQQTERRYAEATAALGGIWEEPVSRFSEETVEDVRILCTMGMLMCLDRSQRLLFIIGDVFGASHTLGAELFGISPGNYRVRLARARADLRQYVQGRCGLVNPANPCRCPKKTQALVRLGLIDPQRQIYYEAHTRRVEEIVARDALPSAREVREETETLFQTHPFATFTRLDSWLQDLTAFQP